MLRRTTSCALVLVVGWLFLYAALAFYPWSSEGRFWRFVSDVSIGQAWSSVQGYIDSSREFRLESRSHLANDVSTNCVIFLGSVDPPRRLYVRVRDDRVEATSPEAPDFMQGATAHTAQDLDDYDWRDSYVRAVLRSLLCCALLVISVLAFIRHRHLVVRIPAVLVGGICFLLLVIDALWATLVYVRYCMLFL